MSNHHYYLTWAYAVWMSKIRLLVVRIWSKSLFPSKPEGDFQWLQFSVITSIDPEHIPFEFWESVHKYSGYEPKTRFWRSFSIFLAKPEEDLQNQRWSALFCIKLELLNYWRLNFENLSISFRAMREQHTDIHTYRHTYRQTDRQTDGTKLLYRFCAFMADRTIVVSWFKESDLKA